jgi:ATP-dependent DNA helicase RecG
MLNGKKLINPSFSAGLPGIVPIYTISKGLTQRQMRESIRSAINMLSGSLKDPLPESFRQRYSLCELNYALENIHFPTSQEVLEQAKRRLAFEDMLYFMLAMSLLKPIRLGQKGIAFDVSGAKEAFINKLDYTPTDAQRRVIDEIAADMRSEKRMNRIIHGDVGSGKTMLALFALSIALKNGYQGVMMAPTDILASQHYINASRFFKNGVYLLKGGMKKSERDEIYEFISNGQAKIIIGTHALIQDELKFFRLGLVITDEQHRFGVRQRAAIEGKGDTPDTLVMSATPIPRTLALIIYGDLDVSLLDELPPGRKPIKTYLVPEHKRGAMYEFIKKQIENGHQAYIVCPLIDESEALGTVKSATELFNELKEGRFCEENIALLHGKLNAADKTRIISAFNDGGLKVLVSTTVVEVGIDVANATVMVIESADRFGLAQLHQLRGRVGRGAEESYCFMLSGTSTPETLERLRTLVNNSDGFAIAQKDLELRGPGEFLGTHQHGIDELNMASLLKDMTLVSQAQAAAAYILSGAASKTEKDVIVNTVMKRYRKKFKEITIN